MKVFFIYSLFLLFTLTAFSQADSLHYDKSEIKLRQISPTHLEKYKNDTDFNYKVEKKKPGLLDKILGWIKDQLYRFLSWILGTKRAAGVLSFIFSIFPYVIALILLFLILKVFLNVRTESIISGNARKTKINIVEEEEIIKNKDIKGLITEALQNNDYRLAIRYWYLYTLQLLERKEIIQWEQQKTNHDYEYEIADKSIQNHFKDITYLYDFVWYGNFEIDKDSYTKANLLFTTMENKIK